MGVTILPARFDGTEVPGLFPVAAYVSLRNISPAQLAEMIKKKVGQRGYEKCGFANEYSKKNLLTEIRIEGYVGLSRISIGKHWATGRSYFLGWPCRMLPDFRRAICCCIAPRSSLLSMYSFTTQSSTFQRTSDS
jgi:hypothetical protein